MMSSVISFTYLSEIETVSYGALSQILPPTLFTNYSPLRNRDFCETEDMILFYLLSKQNVLRWPNTVFARAFADAIQHVHKDFKKQTCRQ